MKKTLVQDCIFWYRARQLRQRRPNIKHQDIFATVNGEMDILKEDMANFVNFTVQASMLSFVHYLENAGYRKIDATAVKVNIVTHSHAGVIIHPEEDAEMIRQNDNRTKKEEKRYFDPHSCEVG